MSLNEDGMSCVDRLSWENFHEGNELISQVEAYYQRHQYYPEKLNADTTYGTRKNRIYLSKHQIDFVGKPLGRPKKQTTEKQKESSQQAQERRAEYRHRIPIEGCWTRKKWILSQLYPC